MFWLTFRIYEMAWPSSPTHISVQVFLKLLQRFVYLFCVLGNMVHLKYSFLLLSSWTIPHLNHHKSFSFCSFVLCSRDLLFSFRHLCTIYSKKAKCIFISFISLGKWLKNMWQDLRKFIQENEWCIWVVGGGGKAGKMTEGN